MIEVRIPDLKPFKEDKEFMDDYNIAESLMLDLIMENANEDKPLSWRNLTYKLTKELAELQDGEIKPEQMCYIGALVDRTMRSYRHHLDLD